MSKRKPRKMTRSAPQPTESRSVQGKSVTVRPEPLHVEGEGQLEFEVLSSQRVLLNHAKAEAYVELPIFRGERPVVETWVQHLRDEMQRGNFNENQAQIATCMFDGTEYKVNGQHTCWAVLFMPKDFQLRVAAIKYKVETADQLRRLYAVHDRGKARSDTHCTTVELISIPELDAIPASVIKRIVPGMKLWLFETMAERSRYTPQQISALVRQHIGVFVTVAAFLREYCDTHTNRSPVFAALFATFDKLPHKAREFWVPVTDGLNLERKTDPRWKLREQLQSLVLQATKGDKKVMTPEDVYRICCSAFIKWRKGEAVQAALRPPLSRPTIR